MAGLYDVGTLTDRRFLRAFRNMNAPGEHDCLEWTGRRTGEGYGVFRYLGVQRVAHRVAWVVHHRREIPAYMVIDHLCGNKACVNPQHLEMVTGTENALRVRTPPPGWVAVSPETPTRRRRQTREECLAATPVRADESILPPPRPTGCIFASIIATRSSLKPTVRERGGKYQVRWREYASMDSPAKQRGRSFPTLEMAQQFADTLKAMSA